MNTQRDWEATNDLEESLKKSLNIEEISPLKREAFEEMLVLCTTYRHRIEEAAYQ